ncbi:unnamed protein product [Leuciscus chuanchicus]
MPEENWPPTEPGFSQVELALGLNVNRPIVEGIPGGSSSSDQQPGTSSSNTFITVLHNTPTLVPVPKKVVAEICADSEETLSDDCPLEEVLDSFDNLTPAGVNQAEAAIPSNPTVPSASMDTFEPTVSFDSMHSPASVSNSTSTSTAVSDSRHDLRRMLLGLQSAVDLVEPGPIANCVNVVRSRVLQCALRTFNRRAFNPHKQLDIVFVDSCGTGEGSVDTGGPTREFLRLLMKELLDSRYFVGPENGKSLALDSLDGDAAVEVDGGDTIKVTLQSVLVFASGASAIPVFGFKENPNITFLHENINGNRRMFPEANTCTITLKLPIGQEYEEFCHFMTSGVIQSPTFGVA